MCIRDRITILLRMLFGKSSAIYKKLYDMSLINSTFGTDYTMQPAYGFTALEGESKDPKRVCDIIMEELGKVRAVSYTHLDVYKRQL